MEEQRLRQRVTFHSSIEIDTEDGIKFFENLDNISMNGFFIKNLAPFSHKEDYDFDLRLMCGLKVINIKGKCTPSRFVSHDDAKKNPNLHAGVGFKITYLEPESSEELYKVIVLNTLD